MIADYSTKRSWSRRLLRTVQMFLLGILLIVGLTLIILYFTGDIAGPVLYRLPGDYRGWVGIRYDDPTCPSLRREGWYLVIPFDANGRACTSSGVPGGWRYRRYEYIYPDGRSKRLSGINEDVWPIGVSGPQTPHIGLLFIGPEEEMKRSWSQQHDFHREMEHKK